MILYYLSMVPIIYYMIFINFETNLLQFNYI